jgi:FkbM family methyltransferase
MSISQSADPARARDTASMKPSLKQSLTRLMDFPGGRILLGKLASRYATQLTGDDLGMFYSEGMWTHRVRDYFFPDSTTFDYTALDFRSWHDQPERYLRDAKDYWFQHYTPNQGDIIVDVGAGRGEDTLAFSRGVGKAGRVIAIEAHPLSFSILTSFCRLNRLTNVTPLNLALMDQTGVVRMQDADSSWLENSIESGCDSGVAVAADTLDRVCAAQNVSDISFLKMNIEGAERLALPGMISTRPRIRQICVACHDFRYDQGHGEQFRTRAFVEGFLADHGLKLVSRADDPRDYVRDHIFGLRN